MKQNDEYYENKKEYLEEKEAKKLRALTRAIAMGFASYGEKFYLEAEIFGAYFGNKKLSGKYKAFYSELEERLYIMPARNSRTGFWFERLINPKYKTL